jgi:hypothetical protein
MEVLVTLFVVGCGFVIFALAVKYMRVFPDKVEHS